MVISKLLPFALTSHKKDLRKLQLNDTRLWNAHKIPKFPSTFTFRFSWPGDFPRTRRKLLFSTLGWIFFSLQPQQITLCLCNEIPKKMKITGLTRSLGVAAAFMVVISFACRGRRNTASRRVGGGAGAVLGGGGGRGCGSGVVWWGTGRGGGRVETSTLLSI